MPSGSHAPGAIVKSTLLVGLPLAGLSLVTANPALTAAAVLVLVAVVALLVRPAEPLALLLVCAIQWLQAAAKVLHADFLGEELAALPAAHHLGISTSATIERAAALSLAWVLVVAVGMRLALWGARPRDASSEPMRDIAAPRLLWVYLAWTLGMFAFGPFARGGVRQLVIAVGDLRWTVVFALFATMLRMPRGRSWLMAIFLGEVGAGFLSFFASFRTPVYLLALAIASGRMRFRMRQFLAFAMVAALALYLGVVWSAIKTDYRATLNRGTGEQVIAIDRREQVAELARLLARVDRETLRDGLERLVDRIGYVDYFAYTLEHVPAIQPHEGGLLWRQAVLHVLQPRLFFPDKPNLESDTRVAERYTGLDLMSWTETTSVALGMPAEAYVDFGVPLMFAAALWIGLLCGWLQRFVARARGVAVLRDGLAVALLLPLAGFEPSTTKFFGGYVTRAVVAWILWKTALRIAGRWVSTGTPATAVPAHGHPAPRPRGTASHLPG